MHPTRREFIETLTTGAVGAWAVCAFGADGQPRADLTRQLGITTGSFMRHLSKTPQEGKLRLLDLPRIMRDDLDLKVLDLMTETLASLEIGYLDELRGQADEAGCIVTNLKMNQKGLDMGSADEGLRRKSLDEYRRTIDLAHRLGCRWVRPAPGSKRPDLKVYAASYRELIQYAAPKGIELLIENNGWMQNDPTAIPQVLEAVGPGLHAAPDTGNWTDQARYEGLAKAFPRAVTCDFKALALGPGGEHAAYDLKRCFTIAWQAGFRGPWCFEHFHDELSGLWREFKTLRDMLRRWMAEAG